MIDLERIPPHSLEAERGVLGCILADQSNCLPHCVSQFTAGEQVFYDLRHRVIYEHCLALSNAGCTIDSITIITSLKDAGQLEGVGGLVYLTEIQDSIPSPLQLPEYIKTVLDKFTRRQAIAATTEFVDRAWNGRETAVALLADHISNLHDLCEQSPRAHKFTSSQVVKDNVELIESRYNSGGVQDGIPSPWPDLNSKIGGFREGELIIVAARPGVGKSSMGMQIADHVGTDLRVSTYVVTMEMSAQQLGLRLISSRARVSTDRIRKGQIRDEEIARLTKATSDLAHKRIIYDDERGQTIEAIAANARIAKTQSGIGMLIVDYLQLARSTKSGKNFTRQQEITEISVGLKRIAGDLEIPVVAMAQLNRNVERERQRAPKLSDLRESGSIEQDSDIVLLLHQTTADDGADAGKVVPVSCEIAKNRNGPVGQCQFTFLKEFTRYESAAKVEPESVYDRLVAPSVTQ